MTRRRLAIAALVALTTAAPGSLWAPAGATGATPIEPGKSYVLILKETVGWDGKFRFDGLPDGPEYVATQEGDGQSGYIEVTPGTFELTEAAAYGWDLTGIVCDDEDPEDLLEGDWFEFDGVDPEFSYDLASRGATVLVEDDEVVACVFTNRAQPGSIVVSSTSIGGDGEFTYSGTGVPDGELRHTTQDGSVTGPTTWVQPGSYDLFAADVNGWDLSALTCDGAIERNGNRFVEVVVGPGQAVTCAFTHTKHDPAVLVTAATSSSAIVAGGSVTIDYTVTNTGNVELHDLEVFDDRLGAVTVVPSVAGGAAGTISLAPGSTVTGKATFTSVTSDGGKTIVHTVTATGTAPAGDEVTDSVLLRVSVVAGAVTPTPLAGSPTASVEIAPAVVEVAGQVETAPRLALAFSGSEAMPVVATGLGLVCGGFVLIGVARSRQRRGT